jgi:predicted acylesterase/phospholipase RssA
MKKIGLALSGGGFRATLYHLGLVRFLRDAGILSHVSHITSVSGGSILAAHLALNWDRYNGSPSDFDAAASEILAFVRLDVRNRIVRRFPLAIPLRMLRRLVGRSNRKLSRTGLLEYHYEKFLYGDTSLFELPEKPQLHILATNLSEGCLCSFHRNGLLMVRRQPGSTFRIDRVHIGLATVAMAVAASSAFPGFFPPLQLTGTDVGANVGEFGRQTYTDGGVFDNLGIRMFRCLERPLLADKPLSREDFVDFPATIEALRQASYSSEETPLRRLGQLLTANISRRESSHHPNALTFGIALPAAPVAGNGEMEALVVSGLGDLLRHYQFHCEPLFAGLQPLDRDVKSLIHANGYSSRALDSADQFWLNRNLLEAAHRQATGRACFRRLNSGLDCVLVSDVGKAFEIKSNESVGGFLRTAMRATDIVMDRVWQLEIETFHDVPGYVFAPVTRIVEPSDDPTALHPEIQRQAAHIRTDLDRFSMLEISSLIRHGYCVCRKTCRARTDLFGSELPNNAPWDPVPPSREVEPPVPAGTQSLLAQIQKKHVRTEPTPAAADARTLQRSALRRIWSTLLDYRDWASYVYVPIIIPILVLMPYAIYKSYQRSHKINQMAESIAQSSRDLEQMSRLLDGPIDPFTGDTPEEVRDLKEPDLSGFEILQDMRILDLRNWNPDRPASDAASKIYAYRRLKVFKKPESNSENVFHLKLLLNSPTAQVRFPPQEVPGRLRMCNVESSVPGQKQCRWEASFNFEKVPASEYVDLIVEEFSPGTFLHHDAGSTTLVYEIHAKSAEVTRWLLLPKGKEYRHYRLMRYKQGKPETIEQARIVTEYLADDSSILAYKLLSVDGGYVYELTWYYK